MDIDTLGTFTMSKAAFPALKAAKSSCIINISMTLHYGATWYQTHASAAKVPNSEHDCPVQHTLTRPSSVISEGSMSKAHEGKITLCGVTRMGSSSAMQ